MCAQKRAPKEKQIPAKEMVEILDRMGVPKQDYGKITDNLVGMEVPREDYVRVLRLASTVEDLAVWNLFGEEAKARIERGYNLSLSYAILDSVIESAGGIVLEKGVYVRAPPSRGTMQKARKFLDGMLDLNDLLKANKISKEEWATRALALSESLVPKPKLSRVAWNIVFTLITPTVLWPMVVRPQVAERGFRKKSAVRVLVPTRMIAEKPPKRRKKKKGR